MMKLQNKSAFTFIELIIVVSLFALLLGAALPPMVGLLFSNELEVTRQELIHVLRHAHERATTQINDSSWGVYFDTVEKTYTLYSGDDYAARDVNFDINYTLSDSVSFGPISLTGGGSEVNFDQITGETSTDGTIALDSATDPSATITVNPIGNVF